jgi:hypothetical protein
MFQSWLDLAVKRIVPALNLLVCYLAFTVQAINKDAPGFTSRRLIFRVEPKTFCE